VAKVAELLNTVQGKRMKALAEEHGGRWKSELHAHGDPAVQASLAGNSAPS